MPQTEHLEWLAQQESHAITAFVIEFQYTDRGQAYAEYEELVLSSHLKGPARKRILEDFESWKRNESRVEMFWLGRESHMAVQKGEKVASTNLIKAATKGLPNTIIQGSATAELSEPVSSRTSAAATATNGGLVASSSITATTSAFYDPKSPFLDTSTPAPSPKGTPTEAESDDVQAQSDARARKRGRMDSGPTKDPESHDNSGEASTRSEKPVQEPEFPDPTANFEQFVALNQEVEWIVQGEDLVQKFREFRAQNLHEFSLARDGIADVTINSKFRNSLAPNVGRAANRVDPIRNLHERWPTLKDVLERVFAESHYDSVDRAIAKENLADPVVRYVMSIIHSYSHYFSFRDTIPTNINERQGFTDLTWCFIRSAMTMNGLETQYLEVLITGVQERRNWARDDLTEAKQVGQFADGVETWEGSQLCLSEASTVHNAKAEKLRQDEFKLARALRDSWVSQVKATSKHTIPRRGIAVYGSSTFNDETRFWRLDFCGVFRLVHFDTFFIPLKKGEFGTKAKEAIIRSLALGMRIKAEVSAREEDAKPIDHEERELLQEMVNSIPLTTSTPTKTHKKRPLSSLS